MDIDKIIFSIDGKIKKNTADKIFKDLATDKMFSGSIECTHDDYKSTYVFQKIDVDTISYILQIIKKDLSEVKIEIQTHDEAPERVQ